MKQVEEVFMAFMTNSFLMFSQNKYLFTFSKIFLISFCVSSILFIVGSAAGSLVTYLCTTPSLHLHQFASIICKLLQNVVLLERSTGKLRTGDFAGRLAPDWPDQASSSKCFYISFVGFVFNIIWYFAISVISTTRMLHVNFYNGTHCICSYTMRALTLTFLCLVVY